MIREMVHVARCYLGGRLYYFGFRIMPPSIRDKVSTINAIGMKWIDADMPRRFTIEVGKQGDEDE